MFEAVGVGVELVDHLRCAGAAAELELDLHPVGGVVVDRRDLHPAALDRRLDRGDQAFGGGAEGDLADRDAAPVAARLQHRAHRHPAPAVVVVRDVGEAALRKVREDAHRAPAQVVDLRLPELQRVVGQDARGHAHGDPLGAQHEHHRQLGGERQRLAGAAVVARRELGERLVEERLQGERREPALDVAGRRGGVARQRVPEVALAVDEQVLVGQHHQGVADRGVAVRVELHRLADHVGHLVVAAVVHLEERVQQAALHRLEAVAEVGDGAVEDGVAGVVDEVAPHQRVEAGH